MADAEREDSDVVRTIGQLVALAAGFIGLVYAAGAGVLALRLYLAHLPSRTIVGQLPRDLLISVGLAQVVLPVLAVAALYATYRFLRGAAAPPKRLVRQWGERSWRAWAEVIGASAFPALVVAGAIALGANSVRGGSKQLLWLDPVQKLSLLAFLLTVLAVLVALNLRARLVDRFGNPKSLWSTRRAIIRMTIVVAVASVPICVIVSGSFFPLLDAKVCTSQSARSSGSSSARRATAPTSAKRIDQPVPGSEIKETFIGGKASMRPCPAPTPTSG